MAINIYISIITLNVNGLNSSVKRQGGRMDKKHDPTICCLEETSDQKTHRLKVKG